LKTIATLCSGGEGVGVGAQDAGIHHLWGIEYDDSIAQVARNNGFNVVTADVTTIDPSQFERPDGMHASPPCPHFSLANSQARESIEDIAIAKAIVRFIETLAPRVFTLENVWGYRKSESWRLVINALNRLGYWTDVQHLNAADFGVPQIRKRMIVRSVLDGWYPPLPRPEPWRGWYSVIEDLIPGLPDSQFAPWQIARLPESLLKAVFNDARPWRGVRRDDEPAHTVTCCNGGGTFSRAFLVSGGNSNNLTIRDADEPANTVVSTSGEKGTYPRAFVLNRANTNGVNGNQLTVREQNEQMFTVTAQYVKNHIRAALHGRVVRMTPRCLARFQSFPNSYILPEIASLAVTVIGNAVPSLMYQRIIEQL